MFISGPKAVAVLPDFLVKKNRTIFLFPVLLGIAATVVVCLALCLSPIRWDYKAFGFVMPRWRSGEIPAGDSIVYVTRGRTGDAAAIYKYGLPLKTFPNGDGVWVALEKSRASRGYNPGYRLDAQGRWHTTEKDDQGSHWAQIEGMPHRLERIAQKGTFVFESEEVRETFRDRYAGRGLSRFVVAASERKGFFEAPGWRLRGTLILRLVFVSIMLALTWRALSSWLFRETGEWLVSCALAVPLTLVVCSFAVYLLGFVTSSAVFFGLLVGGGAGTWWLYRAGEGKMGDATPDDDITGRMPVLRWDDGAGKMPAILWDGAAGRMPAILCAAVGLVVYLGLAALQLDFDGDLFTHWLPSARFHHLLGRHDIGTLYAEYGGAHETTYPPGFPIFLSVLMWVAGVPRDASLQFGPSTNAFTFLYRLAVPILQLSFVIGLVGYVGQRLREGVPRGIALGAIGLLVLLASPVLRAQPMAGEVYLVPMVGMAALALYGGTSSGTRRLTWCGIVLAAGCLFIKNDVLLIIPALLLPIYVVGRLSWHRAAWKAVAADAGVAVLALVPWLVWRIRLGGLGIDTNFMFDPVEPSRLMEQKSLVVALLMRALKYQFRTGGWLIFAVAVPALTLWRLFAAKDWRGRAEVLIPAGVVCYGFGIVTIYVFSRSDPFTHFATSYGRLTASTLVCGLLYISHVTTSRKWKVESDDD